jgi:hypothetical protein
MWVGVLKGNINSIMILVVVDLHLYLLVLAYYSIFI